jgi:hypothetical protein
MILKITGKIDFNEMDFSGSGQKTVADHGKQGINFECRKRRKNYFLAERTLICDTTIYMYVYLYMHILYYMIKTADF